MRYLSIAVAVLSVFLMSGAAIAEITFTPSQDVNLGNITSDGFGGRQVLVRPLEPDDVGRTWKFFPPHDQLPEYFPDPTPPTPAQDDVWLTEGSPLLLVLPQLQHFPMCTDVAVSHTRNGTDIFVDASLVDLNCSTDTIYGPHEYLYPLGYLDAGQYRLTLNCTRSSIIDPLQQSVTTSYVEFRVHPVPEPSALALAGTSLAMLISAIRRRPKRA